MPRQTYFTVENIVTVWALVRKLVRIIGYVSLIVIAFLIEARGFCKIAFFTPAVETELVDEVRVGPCSNLSLHKADSADFSLKPPALSEGTRPTELVSLTSLVNIFGFRLVVIRTEPCSPPLNQSLDPFDSYFCPNRASRNEDRRPTKLWCTCHVCSPSLIDRLTSKLTSLSSN